MPARASPPATAAAGAGLASDGTGDARDAVRATVLGGANGLAAPATATAPASAVGGGGVGSDGGRRLGSRAEALL